VLADDALERAREVGDELELDAPTPAAEGALRLQAGADGERPLEDLADVPAPLALVGVEQGRGGAARHHAVELPREVDGVAHARAHALARRRGHHVGGVAREEDAPRAPALRHERAVRVGGHADDVHPLGVDVAREPAAQRDVVGRGAVVAELKLPPPVAPEAVGVDGEARRVEHVAEVAWEPLGVGRVAQERVDDEPVALGREQLHLRADGLADEAPPAVAAHHPGRAQVARRARRRVARAHRDRGAVVLQGHGLDAREQARVGVAGELGPQHALEGRLVEEARAEVAVGRRRVAHLVGQEARAVLVDDVHAAEGGGVHLQPRHRAGRLEVA
jgi:hypothetical protein